MAGSENNGRRQAFDEQNFNPSRARVKGWVRFLNNGRLVHTIVAEDGSWSAGPLKPAQQRGLRSRSLARTSTTARNIPGRSARSLSSPKIV
jgi:plastocyanin